MCRKNDRGHVAARNGIGGGTQNPQCVVRLDQQQPCRIDPEFDKPQPVEPAIEARPVILHPHDRPESAATQRQ